MPERSENPLYDQPIGAPNPYVRPTDDPAPGMEWVWTGSAWAQQPIAVTTPEPLYQGPLVEPEIDRGPDGTTIVPPEPYTPSTPLQPLPTQPDATAPPSTSAGGNPYTSLPPTITGAGAAPVPTTETTAPPGTTEPFFSRFDPPQYTSPAPFTGPEPFQSERFAYEPFRAPSLQDAYAEPGYEFGRREGERALMNSQAGRGRARTGDTYKDLIRWGQGFAEQNYQNVYARSADSYDRNRRGAFETFLTNRHNAASDYTTNYGTARDVYDRTTNEGRYGFEQRYQGASDVFNADRQAQTLTFEDLYRRWQQQLAAQLRLAEMPIE